MLQKYRETEVPLRNMEMRRRYKHQLTDSNAVVIVCQVLKDCVHFRDNLPEDVVHMNRTESEIDTMIVKKMKWPI